MLVPRSTVGLAALGFVAAAVLTACGGTSTGSTAASGSSTAAPASGTVGGAADGGSSGGTAPGAAASGSLSAADQTSDGTSVRVAAVALTGTQHGWVAVHMDLGGKPGPVVGEVAVNGGTAANVVVPLAKKISTGAFWPMLHVDDHVVGTYEFPQVAGADLPVKADGMVVMKKITVTVG